MLISQPTNSVFLFAFVVLVWILSIPNQVDWLGRTCPEWHIFMSDGTLRP